MKKSFLFLTPILALSCSVALGDESFSKYDSNRDGSVEYRELAMAKKQAEFDKMDRNRDSAVTSQEYEAVEIETSGEWDLFATPDFKSLDTDNNGTITLAEFGGAVKGLIQKIDTSGDAKVTTEEYAAAVTKGKEAAAKSAIPKGSGPKGSAPKGSTPKP
ncbi:MAG: EF-hand domain-containing protein [Verrucomicrobiales bacterium]|nr:EF-hand domain-containing protein [Verrucomicrobiales bacterium]